MSEACTVCRGSSIQLGVLCCDRLLLLADRIAHKQTRNSYDAHIFFNLLITLEQIRVSKASIRAELTVLV